MKLVQQNEYIYSIADSDAATILSVHPYVSM